MILVVSSAGDNIDSDVSPGLATSDYLVIADNETLEAEGYANPAADASDGAAAARFAIDHDADVVITAEIGPEALEMLEAAGIPVYAAKTDGMIRQSVALYSARVLERITEPTLTAEHA
jgi:predicted Fe-Mo cluster-binding NifX family protein